MNFASHLAAGHVPIGPRQLYRVLLAGSLELDGAEREALPELGGFWDTVPLDQHTKARAADGVRCSRSRALARVELEPLTGRISRLPDKAFVQGANNRYVPNMARSFGHVPDAMLENAALTGLIRFVWSTYDIEAPWSRLPWEVGLHFIRTHGALDEPTHVVPEGPHTDGFAFVAMVSAGQFGLCPRTGLTEMYRAGEPSPLETVRLSDMFDLIVAADTLTLHNVTPIRGVQSGSYRNALVLTWHQTVSGSPYFNRNERKEGEKTGS